MKEVIVKEKKRTFAGFFDCPSKPTLREGGFFSRNRYVLLAFAVPFLIMFSAFAIMGCQPFGDKQILVTDLWHQFFPFLVDFQDKLRHGESLFWSWTQGGGTNYFALMSYYLMSPLNFLTVILPSGLFGINNIQWVNMFLTLAVAVKIALAGCFFSIFLRYTFKRDDISLTIFSTCFALSAFFMGYYWCEIWLDTVALTPLVVMGFIAMMREGKYRLYVVTLALSVLANYYIGLFTCIFMAICFIGYQICAWDGIKAFGKKLLKMAIWSVVAIMLTAFMILPAYFALQNTHAASSSFPSSYAINIGSPNDLMGTLDAIKQVISNTAAFVKPATTGGLPNIACGVTSVIVAIVFMVNKKIKLRAKLFHGGLLLFLILSFIIRQLDYIWHGFHFTNMIPYRFSYLVSFTLVVMAFRAFQLIDEIDLFDLSISSLVMLLIVLLCIGTQELLPILGTAAIAVVILAVLFIYKKSNSKKSVKSKKGLRFSKQALCFVLFFVVIIQSAVTGYIGVSTTTVTTTYDYPRGGADTANVVDMMKQYESNTPELWRADFTSTQTLCDSSLNTFNGYSMFNSMVNEKITRFTENFGLMGWLAGNRYTYAESTPVANLFLNLKYIIARDGGYNDTNYLSEVYASNNVKLLKNKAYIPMGFMVNKNLLNYQGIDAEDTYNPFDKQNQFFKLATGIEKDIFTPLDVVSQGHTPYESFPVNRSDYGSYTFSCNAGFTEAPHLKWNYEAPKDGWYYAYVRISNEDGVSVYCNDAARTGTSSFYIKRPYIMSIGYFSKGDKISIYSDLEANASGTAQVYVNLLDTKTFDEGFEKLKENPMTTTNLTGSSMDGTIDVKQDGLLYTSIPYEQGREETDTLIGKLFGSDSEGWTATVDGQKAEIKPLAGALVTVELTKGQHNVRFSYLPKGFIKGMIISLSGLMIFVGYTVFVFVRKKKKKS